MPRLLIIACSEKKSSARGRLPTIDPYNGPAFQVLRRFFREHSGDKLVVWILSAKFGLISSDAKIPNNKSDHFNVNLAALRVLWSASVTSTECSSEVSLGAEIGQTIAANSGLKLASVSTTEATNALPNLLGSHRPTHRI